MRVHLKAVSLKALKSSVILLPAVILSLLFPFHVYNASPFTQEPDDEVVKVDAELVLLNVTVTDRDGRYVDKLKPADFTVFEDGRAQRVTLFSEEETPFAAAILLDTSGSMEGRMTLARAAAIRFLDGLRADDVASVYHFNHEVEQLQDFSHGRDLPPMAYALRSKGMTVLNDAIVRAARDLSTRPEKRKAIVVLSDGADTRSSASADKALDAALTANAVIYTVDMMSPNAPGLERMRSATALKNFASKSGGRFVSTPGGAALSEAFEEIVEELSNQYTLGYRPSNRSRDGRWRSIELKMSRDDLQTRTRDGYRARKR